MRLSARRHSASPLRPLLLLLPLMLTLAAHANVSEGLGGQRVIGGTTPSAWHRLMRHDPEASGGHQRGPTADHEVPARIRRGIKGNEVRPDKQDVDCKNLTAGADQLACNRTRQQAGAASGPSSWLRHYLRPKRFHSGRRRKPVKHAASSNEGEDIFLKEELRNRTRRSLNQSEKEGIFFGLLDEIIVEEGESNILIRSPLLNVGTDITVVVEFKVQCVPKACNRSRESIDPEICNKDLRSFMDIIMAYSCNGSRRNELHNFSLENKNASSSDFEEPHGKVYKKDITNCLPKLIKEITCRYDLVEVAANDNGKKKVGCEKICRLTMGGRIFCICAGSEKDDDLFKVVRSCKPIDPNEMECPEGYYLDTVAVDINECESFNGGCAHVCENTNGGFRCQCRPGYFLMEDQKSCDDVDECEGGRSLAGCAYKCKNLPLRYECTCPEGYSIYQIDASSCINEKENIFMNRDGVFYPKSTLPASEGKCPRGFTLDAGNATCTDIDECRQNMSVCRDVCENVYGGYKCKCRLGYGLMQDGRSCADIDECFHKLISGCQHECANTEGSYRCECRAGYRLREDRKLCEDIDECREHTDGCSHGCENTVGSYKCLCSRGFYLAEDDTTCRDIDECRLVLSDCEQECENTEGSFRCKCRPGYTLTEDQKSCRDIDECERKHKKSVCTQLCENTVGSFRCKCRPGYFLLEDGRSCDNHDECAPDQDVRTRAMCTHNCINEAMGYTCYCPLGYRMSLRMPFQCFPDERYFSISVEGAD